MTCTGCGGTAIRSVDGFCRCFNCGMDADYPARPPTAGEKALAALDRRIPSVDAGAAKTNAERDSHIIYLHESGLSYNALAERFGLSATRVSGIIKYGQ